MTDLNSAREALSTCVAQMTKLKEFLDDDNCWWKLFKKREFNCCGQKSPHLHGYLDGTMVTLRMLEETSEVHKLILMVEIVDPSIMNILCSNLVG